MSPCHTSRREGAIRLSALAVAAVIILAGISFAQAESRPQSLTPEARLYGLSQIWQTAANNFALFAPGEAATWDETYQQFIPRILAAHSDSEYFGLLQEFCATLHDGHTLVIPPDDVREQFDRPNIQVRNVDHQAIVTAVGASLGEEIPIGSRILAVDGLPTEEYVRSRWFPRTSASTQRLLWEIGILKLLEGPKGTRVEILCEMPDGRKSAFPLERNSRDEGEPRVNRYPRTDRRMEYRQLDGGLAYVALHTFADQAVLSDFEEVVPEILEQEGIIIDLRRNGGGESDIGYAILEYLVDKPLLSYHWKTRMQYGAYRAWGRWTSEFPAEELADLSEERREYLDHYHGEAWFAGEAEEILPEKKGRKALPLVVLIGSMTGSAAEDFLVPLSSWEKATFVGQATAGFTGTPLVIDLPGGGVALINTTREYYPTGEEIRGGVEPDIVVEPTVGDFVTGRDAALEKACAILRRRP